MTSGNPATPGLAPRLHHVAAAAHSAIGQATWAAGQMAALIFLSNVGLQRLVGIFSLGIGVFAVVALILGLNLRVAVSAGQGDSISYSAALRARLIACGLALPLAIGAMALTDAGSEELLAASLLVAGRVPDQLSDVTTGFYLRDDRQKRISRSFLLRGIVAVTIVALSWALDWSAALMASLLLAGAIIATSLYDLWPEARRRRGEHRGSIAAVVRATWSVSPYPALDSLHVNSLRFALVAVTGPAFFGLVAIAQLIYTPFQIAMNALGFGYLRSARRAHDRGGGRLLWRHILLGLGLGTAIGGAFVLTCLFLPDLLVRLLFADKAAAAAEALLVAAVALGFAPICGFLSLCVVTGVDRRSYLAAPIAGLVLVWVAMGVVLIGGGDEAADKFSVAMIVAMVFAASFALRALWSLRALSLTVARGQKTGADPAN